MTKIKEDGIRRVYVLPSELVERITAHQAAKGYSSEVETVRKLIDAALNLAEDEKAVLVRLKAHLSQGKDLTDAARDVLVGHPLVTDISFHKGYLQFWLKDLGTFRLEADGMALRGGKDASTWNEIPV